MSQVYITKTSPKTVIADYQKLVRRANYKKAFDLSQPIVIKINLSWTKFYPACSTPPWQLEAVVKTMFEDGIPAKRIIPVENRTVVTNVYQGAEYIITPNGDKGSTSSSYLTFDISTPANVYVLFDDRATTLPAWLNDGT